MSVVVFACHDPRHMSAAYAHKDTHMNTYAQTLEFYTHTDIHISRYTLPITQGIMDFHCIELHDPDTVCVCVKAP